MRHRRKFNHLSRTAPHRRAMFANMASSLILHKRIHTTVAKAKALRIYIEPLITKSKEDSTHSRRTVFSYLQNKEAVTELFREISQKVIGRPGGYTRILKLGTRLGDSAEMAMIELVDYNENLLAGGKGDKDKAGRKSRRRRGGKKKGEPEVATQLKETAKSDEVTKPEVAQQTETAQEPESTTEATEATEAIASSEPEKSELPDETTEEKKEEKHDKEQKPEP